MVKGWKGLLLKLKDRRSFVEKRISSTWAGPSFPVGTYWKPKDSRDDPLALNFDIYTSNTVWENNGATGFGAGRRSGAGDGLDGVVVIYKSS